MLNSSWALLVTGAILLMVVALLSVILIAMWVYRDAKSRGLDAKIWTLAVIMAPNLLGLILYLLIGRRDSRFPCPTCGTPMPEGSAFCGRCGAELPHQATPRAGTRTVGKGMLIAAVVGIVLSVLLGIGLVVTLAVADDFDWSPSVSTIYVENSWGDQWSVKWHYTNKGGRDSFTIDENGPKVLSFTGSCGEGPLTLRVYQGDVERSFDLSGGEEVKGDLLLSDFRPGKVHLELNNGGGAGKNVIFHAEWK